MEMGHLVDYFIEWNEANEQEDDKKNNKKKTNKPKATRVRKATQSDWDSLLG